MEKEIFDLGTLLRQMEAAVEDTFPDRVWVRAEVVSLSVRNNGHCYMELSHSEGGALVAKARAVIWRSRYTMLSEYFRQATGGAMRAGISILARAQVQYSPLYGLTLVIDDLDADVTIGELERIRRETIARLEQEGLMEMQAALSLSPLPYALAVISAHDAAGYGDFRRHLEDNEWGFRYHVDLYEAAMQGSGAPESVSDALDAIETSGVAYDAVLIIRGGGSPLDLACFDDYALCCNIARFPVPVFTAIGHDRDRHVADIVAFGSVKTPTALADSFLDCFAAEDERVASFGSRLRTAFISKLAQMLSRVDMLSERIMAADPRQVLRRGYCLAVDGAGRVLSSVDAVAEGDSLRLLLSDGTLWLRVDKVEHKSPQDDGRRDI